MYREAIAREDEERKFGDDFFRFLKSCNIKINLFPYNENFFDRVCELLQRTNQLNFSGRKYRREEIVPILAEPGLEKWVIECSNRFGSYGVVEKSASSPGDPRRFGSRTSCYRAACRAALSRGRCFTHSSQATRQSRPYRGQLYLYER